MIKVTLSAPPHNFELKVKRPGELFLLGTPSPAGTDWDGHDYWRAVHKYLYRSHKGICFYCASYSPRSGHDKDRNTSVDHWLPKSARPDLAYEWTNFRLCRIRLNRRKADHQDLIDPCNASSNWFEIQFTTFLLVPSPGLPTSLELAVRRTIAILMLNDDQDYLDERSEVILQYSQGKLTFTQLQQNYPFIAYQMIKHNFDLNYRARIKQIADQRSIL